MIDSKSRLFKIGGSEIDRMLRSKETEINCSCDCSGVNCNGIRYFLMEDGYSLFLEKIGVAEKKEITNDCYINFGNMNEHKVLNLVNKELSTNYQEKNNIENTELKGFSVINVDGYDADTKTKLLEIKTTTKKNKVDLLKYYYQIMYYMYVLKLDKALIAIASRPEIYHLNKQEIEKVNITKVEIYEVEYDKEYFNEVLYRINKFCEFMEIYKDYGIIVGKEEYDEVITAKFNKKRKMKKKLILKKENK